MNRNDLIKEIDFDAPKKVPYWFQTQTAKCLFEHTYDNNLINPVGAIPTGGGKTVVMCDLADRHIDHKRDSRILVLSHVKEILEQNFKTLQHHFQEQEIGLYSSGLNSRTIKPITVAGIQSIARTDFVDWDYIYVDECHRVNPKEEGQYRDFIKQVNCSVVGLTASPFRLGHGYIHQGENALFNRLPSRANFTSLEAYNGLVSEGFICPLVSHHTDLGMSTQGLKKRLGDFITADLSQRFDQKAITNKAVQEIVSKGKGYKKWLIFAIDTKHADHISERLNIEGITNHCIHSNKEHNRSNKIKDFRDGYVKAIVNVEMLTTGFDVPDLDLIAMLRPTESPVIHVQAIGRGSRVFSNKPHCLVLDFARNTERLGAVNQVYIKKKNERSLGTGGVARVKTCPNCKSYASIQCKRCEHCGFEFIFKTKLTAKASKKDVVAKSKVKQEIRPRWLRIASIRYSIHNKANRPPSVKVEYSVKEGLLTHKVNEWVCIEHHKWPDTVYRAKKWLKTRTPEHMNLPETTERIIWIRDSLLKPTQIYCDPREKPYPEARGFKYD